MNTNAKKWVETLRSGKYKQGKGLLNTNNTNFCCLGVACELAIEAGIDLKKEIVKNYKVSYIEMGYKGQESHEGVLPKVVRDWLGLKEINGEYRGGQLTMLNDTGKTFSEIADIIESEPEGLFNQCPP